MDLIGMSFCIIVVKCISFSQVLSKFILESERKSFIEQVREVIEMPDDKGEGMKEGYAQPPFTQVTFHSNTSSFPSLHYPPTHS